MNSGRVEAGDGPERTAGSRASAGVTLLLCGTAADRAGFADALASNGISAEVIDCANDSAATLRAGLTQARHELVAIADAPVEPAEVARLLSLADRNGLVFAERPASGIVSARSLASRTCALLTRTLLGVPGGRGSLIGSRERLAEVLDDVGGLSDRAELIARARQAGMNVTEVRLAGAASAELLTLVQTARAAQGLVRFWWNGVLHAEPAEPDLSDRRRFWGAIAALVVLCVVLFYTHLSHPLVEPDEGRHAEIPREMVATGNWLVPHFNGDPYYDKPPLFYWLCATSYSVFGVSERSARLVPATATTLLVLLLFVWGRRRFGTRPAFLGAAVLALSPGAAYVGRFVVLDSLLDLLVASSLMLACMAVGTGRLRWGWWVASALCCGLGLLAKGPVSLALTVPPLAAFAWLDARAAFPKVRHWAAYGFIAVAVAAPWFAAVIASDPEYARYFFWDHNVGRFLVGANHPKPVWFYAPVLLLGCLPWSLLFVPLVPFLLGRSARLQSLRPRGTGFLVLWAGWTVLFFTASSGKLPTYVLPAVPPLSMLVGLYLDRLLFLKAKLPLAGYALRFVPRYGAAALCWAGLIVSAGLPLVDIADWRAVREMLVFWPACLVALGVTWWRIRPWPSYVAFGAIALAWVLDATHDYLPRWAEKRSLFAAAGRLDGALKDPDVEVACWGNEWGSVPFYLRRDDVTNFEHGGVARAEQFLLVHERSFLLLKGEFEINAVASHLPPGRTLTHLTDIGQRRFGAPGFARLYVVEPASTASETNAAKWARLAAQGDPGKL